MSAARPTGHTAAVHFAGGAPGAPPAKFDHLARPEQGLNICVGNSMLRDVHMPRDATVGCPPDPVHIYWVDCLCAAAEPPSQICYEYLQFSVVVITFKGFMVMTHIV